MIHFHFKMPKSPEARSKLLEARDDEIEERKKERKQERKKERKKERKRE